MRARTEKQQCDGTREARARRFRVDRCLFLRERHGILPGSCKQEIAAGANFSLAKNRLVTLVQRSHAQMPAFFS